MRSDAGEPWSICVKSPGVRSEFGAGTFVLEGGGGAGGELRVIARSLTVRGARGCEVLGEAGGAE